MMPAVPPPTCEQFKVYLEFIELGIRHDFIIWVQILRKLFKFFVKEFDLVLGNEIRARCLLKPRFFKPHQIVPTLRKFIVRTRP